MRRCCGPCAGRPTQDTVEAVVRQTRLRRHADWRAALQAGGRTMTLEQYRRWKNFSLRMGRRGFSLRLRKSRRELAGFVKDFFRTLDQDYFTINETLPAV